MFTEINKSDPHQRQLRTVQHKRLEEIYEFFAHAAALRRAGGLTLSEDGRHLTFDLLSGPQTVRNPFVQEAP